MADDVILGATALTVEYDTVRGVDAVVLAPFPSGDARAVIFGSVADLRDVVDSIVRLLDDLDDVQ